MKHSEDESIDAAALDERLRRIERLAVLLDSQFKIPFTGVRFGWDAIVGLVPGAGDVVTLVPQIYLIYEACQTKVGKRLLAQMALNVLIDVVVGSIPVLGDIFDVIFKSNLKNAQLLADAIRMQESDDTSK